MTEETQYFDPSDLGSFYLAHSELMAPLQTCEENKAFGIAKGDAGASEQPISLKVLRSIAERFTVGKKVFVVLEHENGFEVRRLKDGESASLFYKFLNPERLFTAIGSAAEDNVLQLVIDYKACDFDYIQKYDKACSRLMKAENVFSASYISRRVASMASFRKSEVPTGILLNTCLASLCEKGVIREVPPKVAAGTFETSGRLFQVLKNAD